MIVMKFGGTSLSTPANICKVIAIVSKARNEQNAAAVVCSAFAGVTNELIRLSSLAVDRSEELKAGLSILEKRHRDAVNQLVPSQWQEEAMLGLNKMMSDLADVLQGVYLLREASLRSLDFIMSFGERLSAYIVSYAMRVEVTQAEYLDARTLIRTNDSFGLARVDWDVSRVQINNHFNNHSELQIVTGFIAATEHKHTTTLGRGGSDFTVSLLGAALECEEIQIWTDVSGVLTADPRKVDGALAVPTMSYDEAMEVAHFGAKVIYPPTMVPAMTAAVPLRIKNTFAPQDPGTVIGAKGRTGSSTCAITSIPSVALLQLKGTGLIGVAGISRRLFATLANAEINVILISQASSEHSICFAVGPDQADAACNAVSEEFEKEILKGHVDKITLEKELSIIAVVGESMRDRPGVSGRIFSSLGRNSINVEAIAQGSSELNVSLVVKHADERRALRILHEAFFASQKVTRLFLVGYGLIGKTLIGQLYTLLEGRKNLPIIKICGLANSRRMISNEQGIILQQVEGLLEKGQKTDLGELMALMKRWPNSILVDCTASKHVPTLYVEALKHGISVVTPNKIANTNTYQSWRQLQELSLKPGVDFLYEANVGAGLPVIETLRELVDGGDHVVRIEAILSGTLSYLFNTFKTGDSFSELLAQAREQGFTEPDPRDDLSGTDVARKILILARECGYEFGLEDVSVENLVPTDLRENCPLENLFSRLREHDAAFSLRLNQACEQGKVLRYVAVLDQGRASVGLQAVGPEHPCYHVDACDNIVSFTTRRYSEQPMVIKGPGAGAEVTAAQCLAEILRIAKQKD